MAVPTTYIEPGVLQNEVVVADGLNLPAQPFAVCLVGTGSRNKRITNEAVLKGQVTSDPLTVATLSPHLANLANRSNRKIETTTLTKTLNGISTVIPDTYFSFDPAYVLGTVTATVDLSVNNALALEMDVSESVTVVFHDVPVVTTTDIVFAISGATVTLSKVGETFITKGIRPGTTLTIATAEDAGNNGTFTVLTVPSQTSLTYTNATGVANVDDDTASVTFSGTGFSGREVHPLYNFTAIAAATITEIKDALNQALAASTSLGYGTAYASAASVSSGALKLTSPITSSSSDVEVFAPISNSALINIFGAPTVNGSNRSAVSVLRIADAVYSTSATWTLDYVRLLDDADPLAQTSNIQTLVAVGSSPGTSNFQSSLDFQLTANQVDWSPDTAAVVTGIAGVEAGNTFDVNPNDQLVLVLDGKTSAVSGSTIVTIDLNGLTPAPLNYVNPSNADQATAAELVVNINAVLAQHLGPRYSAVASSVTIDGTPRVRLTSPIQGRAASSIEIRAASANSAHTTLFGSTTSVLGTGSRPADGTVYFVTYEFTRPTTEYDTPFRFFSLQEALSQIGNPSPLIASYNPLAIAASICFENGSEILYIVQVNDTTEGNPTRGQVLSALEGAKVLSGTTEIVVVGEPGTRLDVTTDVVAHLEDQNSSTEKHPRRGFFGMAANTPIGDRSTANTMVYRASRTLQVSPTSPARGRMFLLAPPQVAGVTRNVTFEDGVEARISLDSTYIAAATAARRTSLLSPSETLTRRTITGFNTDDITTAWKPAERKTLASQGVMVLTFDGGRLIFLDAISTEGGGGNLEAFRVDSTSYAKDIVVTKVSQALDANIIGIVPFDLISFMIDIKLIVQGVIANEISKGTIGPFRTSSGETRPVDLRTDIKVLQDPNSPTTYELQYFFNLLYPALRIFGTYSVDKAFFSLSV